MVTKRSGQAQTALISRRLATVERTRGRHPPERIRANNKSSTNWRLGQTDSDSQTKRVKSFGRLGPSGSLGRLNRPFPLAARHKASANQRLAESQAQAGSLVSAPCLVKSGCQSLACSGGALPRSGTRTKERAQREPESATRRGGRFAARKAIPIRPPGRAAVRSWSPKPCLLRRFAAPIRDAGEGNGHKGGRNQRHGAADNSLRERQSQFALAGRLPFRSWSPKPSLLRRLAAPIRDAGEGNEHKGSRNQRRGAAARFAARKAIPIRVAVGRSQSWRLGVNSAGRLWLVRRRPIQPPKDRLAPQSIIAALRMHTIVACAGFSLRLRMR